MNDSSRPAGLSFGGRLARAFRNIVIFSIVVCAAGAALYATSALNAKTFVLEVRSGQLVVLKGRMQPTGAEPWQPADAALAETYAPIDLQGNTSLSVTGVKFADRDELDRAVFTVIELIAKPRVSSDAPRDLEVGLALLHRGERLTGLTADQKASLKSMRSEVAFYLARKRLEDARKQLEDAVADLKLAADADAKHKREATQMLLTVEPQVKQLSDTVRAAVNQLAAPSVPDPRTVVRDLSVPQDTAPPADAKKDALPEKVPEPASPEVDSKTVPRP